VATEPATATIAALLPQSPHPRAPRSPAPPPPITLPQATPADGPASGGRPPVRRPRIRASALLARTPPALPRPPRLAAMATAIMHDRDATESSGPETSGAGRGAWRELARGASRRGDRGVVDRVAPGPRQGRRGREPTPCPSPVSTSRDDSERTPPPGRDRGDAESAAQRGAGLKRPPARDDESDGSDGVPLAKRLAAASRGAPTTPVRLGAGAVRAAASKARPPGALAALLAPMSRVRGGSGGRVPGAPRPGGAEASRAALRRLRSELLDVEEAVPWSAVTPGWRGRRPAWRRALRASDAAACVARALREFRAALAPTAPPLLTATGDDDWLESVDAVAAGAMPGATLHPLWGELRDGVAAWVGAAPRRPGAAPKGSGSGSDGGPAYAATGPARVAGRGALAPPLSPRAALGPGLALAARWVCSPLPYDDVPLFGDGGALDLDSLLLPTPGGGAAAADGGLLPLARGAGPAGSGGLMSGGLLGGAPDGAECASPGASLACAHAHGSLLAPITPGESLFAAFAGDETDLE